MNLKGKTTSVKRLVFSNALYNKHKQKIMQYNKHTTLVNDN